MEVAGEGEHERHDVRADVVVVDLAEVGDDDRVLDQRRIVVAGGRRGLRRLEPPQPLGLCEQIRVQRAERAVGVRDGGARGSRVLGHDDLEPGNAGLDARGPLARLRALWRGAYERWPGFPAGVPRFPWRTQRWVRGWH